MQLQPIPSRTRWLTRALVAAGLACLAGTAAANIVLYEGDNFSGRSYTVDVGMENLDRTPFNDRASSLVINTGSWQVCTDAYFRGNCRTLGPGQYPTLGGLLEDRISSVRLIDRAAGAERRPDVDRWNEGGRTDRGHRGPVQLTLFDGIDLSGNAFTVRDAVEDLQPTGFNDRTWSIDIQRGSWEMCSDADYRGECYTLGPGRYRDLPRGLAGRLSSVRPVAVGGVATGNATGNGVRLYAEIDFRGPSLNVVDRTDDLQSYDFADRASSMFVYEGRWEACNRPSYRGQCTVYGPGEYRSLGQMSGRISSIRRVG